MAVRASRTLPAFVRQGLWRGLAWPILLAVGPSCLAAGGVFPPANPKSAEARLEFAIDRWRRGDRVTALTELDRLVAQYPNFRLGHLVRGDVLSSRVRGLAEIGDLKIAESEALDDLRAEARMRLSNRPPVSGQVPRYLLKAAPSQRTAIVVDTSRSRVLVFDTSAAVPRMVGDFYASIGKNGARKEREGDKRTPIGVYRVTSRIPGAILPDLYGGGAFPLDYPNGRDRVQGRTGSGIWIHGVPSSTYVRAPRASDGCVAMANPDLDSLSAHILPGVTQVVIASAIEWVAPSALLAERDAFLPVLERWRMDWESGDTERYLSNYAHGFRTDGGDRGRWAAGKRRINARKAWISLALSEVSVYRDPSAPGLLAVNFAQDYRSSNFSERIRKTQHWALEEGRWKIVYEAPVGAPARALPESYPGRVRAARPQPAGPRG